MSESATRRSAGEAARELAGAEMLAFGGVGFAGKVLPATEAYERLLDAAAAEPERVRAEADGLLAKGSPAGKAYAATLLERLDPAAGRRAWESLTGDKSPLTTFSGCVMNRVSLGEYAAARLAGAS